MPGGWLNENYGGRGVICLTACLITKIKCIQLEHPHTKGHKAGHVSTVLLKHLSSTTRGQYRPLNSIFDVLNLLWEMLEHPADLSQSEVREWTEGTSMHQVSVNNCMIKYSKQWKKLDWEIKSDLFLN